MVTKLQRSDSLDRITELLGPNASDLLNHSTQTISKDNLQLPGPDFIDRVWSISDRSPAVLRSLQSLFDNGRLAGTGYLSILPVDQGIEHSAGASFAPNPQYFDPENIVKLAIEGGCNAVASTFGVLGSVARKYAHKIPFIVKINHNELLTLPNKFDQVLFGTVKEAHNLGAVAVGATIYFGSDESTRQIVEISQAFAQAHELGMVSHRGNGASPRFSGEEKFFFFVHRLFTTQNDKAKLARDYTRAKLSNSHRFRGMFLLRCEHDSGAFACGFSPFRFPKSLRR